MAAALRAPCALSRPSTVSQFRQQRTGAVAVRAQKVEAQGAAASGAVLDQPARQPSPAINLIQPVTRWPEGIPPAMGGHFMPSGAAAPLSQSKGPGIDIHPLMFTYPAGGNDVAVQIYDSDFAAVAGLAEYVAKASAEAIAARGAFTIALSGGSLVKSLAGLVGRSDVDFSKWWVLFVDERNVPLSSDDSNYKAAHAELLRKVPVPANQVLAIKEGLPVQQAATHYAGQLLELPASVLPRTADAWPVLDCVLLGVGPDGHIASLFPNRKETAATEGWVLPVSDSPKPPAERITLTLPVINAAKNVAVVALGQGKAEVVQRALEVQSLPGALPVQLVQPAGGKLSWVLDQASAAKLRIPEWAEGSKKFPRSENPPKSA
ncbi:hypothetical protein COHA_008821 [Chlorella ohadii]|uniref:6-phosphogluconolactonase n=1 Tax=Chlorella ohadii TaxID=2649997 RepID=A0AAD5GYE4_9CHLO|nr:hypothetical protein COHA_008821 [Chlorella ohadii]